MTCGGSGAKPGTGVRQCAACNGTGHVARQQGGFAFSEPCRVCGGNGTVVDDPCPTCHGSGQQVTTSTLSVRIPAGVSDGQRIRIAGRGRPGVGGAPAGDLLVRVHVRAHPVFGRKGDDVTVTLPVTFPEAALGATVPVPLLDGGTVTVKIPAGTSSGRVLRVRGKGVARKGRKAGDLLATVEVVVPSNVDGKAKEALEAYHAALTESGEKDGPELRAHLYAKAGGSS
jgi:molecular chaperone DnaJ